MRLTIVELLCEPHHGNRHRGAVGSMEQHLVSVLGVEGHLPKAVEVHGIEQDQARLVSERSSREELRDHTCEEHMLVSGIHYECN